MNWNVSQLNRVIAARIPVSVTADNLPKNAWKNILKRSFLLLSHLQLEYFHLICKLIQIDVRCMIEEEEATLSSADDGCNEMKGKTQHHINNLFVKIGFISEFPSS